MPAVEVPAAEVTDIAESDEVVDPVGVPQVEVEGDVVPTLDPEKSAETALIENEDA